MNNLKKLADYLEKVANGEEEIETEEIMEVVEKQEANKIENLTEHILKLDKEVDKAYKNLSSLREIINEPEKIEKLITKLEKTYIKIQDYISTLKENIGGIEQVEEIEEKVEQVEESVEESEKESEEVILISQELEKTALEIDAFLKKAKLCTQCRSKDAVSGQTLCEDCLKKSEGSFRTRQRGRSHPGK